MRYFNNAIASVLLIACLAISACSSSSQTPPPESPPAAPPPGETSATLNDACQKGWLVSSSPENGATDVAVDAKISLGISDEIDMPGYSEKDISILISAALEADKGVSGDMVSPISGSIAYKGNSRSIDFTPARPLPYGSRVVVSANFNPCSVANNSLSTFSFSTAQAPDKTPPEVNSSLPAEGDADVATNVRPSATFSEAPNPASITAGHVMLKDSNSMQVAAAVTYDEASMRVTLMPQANLAHSAKYTLEFSGITDRAGNLMADTRISFTTGEAPDVTSPAKVDVALKGGTRTTLMWIAPGDDGDIGTAARYELKYSSQPIAAEEGFAAATPLLSPPAPALAGSNQEFTPKGLTVGNYYFSLRAYDEAGSASPISSDQISVAGRTAKLAEPVASRAAGDYFAKSIAGRCDVNSDGLPDVVAGAPNNSSGGPKVGRAFVILGRAGGDIGGPGDLSVPDVTIDGIDTDPANASDYFGFSVSCGDFNGDMIADIAVGAYAADLVVNGQSRANMGAVYLFYGSGKLTAGSALRAGEADMVLQGLVGAYFGYSVAFLGDIDSDGKDELAIVSPGAAIVNQYSGVAYIFHHEDIRGRIATDADARTRILGEAAAQLSKVGPGGDIDGDGLMDIAVASPYYPNTPQQNPERKGRLYVLLGSGGYYNRPAIHLPSDASFTITGEGRSDWLGGYPGAENAFSLRGDIDGDGIGDLAVATPYAAGSDNLANGGRVYLFHGRSGEEWRAVDGPAFADVVIKGMGGSYAGWAVDAGGDFNSDGADDLLVSARNFGSRGAGFIFFGHGGWPAAKNIRDADVKIADRDNIIQNVGLAPTAASDYWGDSAAFLGDIDGDGYGDAALGSQYADILGVKDAGGLFIIR